jgi:trehalose-phosphatase
LARLKSLWTSLAEIAGRLTHAGSIAVASDFDGTLTPIAEHPDAAVMTPRARRALEELVGLPRTSVAVLSGRALEDLRRVLGVDGVHLAGAAGLETLDITGHHERHVSPGSEIPVELRRDLEEWCRRFPGAWLEDKGPSFALHYRALPVPLHGAFAAGVRRRVEARPGRVRLVPGRKVLEVLPAVAWDKAAALAAWLSGLEEPLPFFLGDDTVDEPVHAAVRERGGVTVAVGRRASRAEYGLPDPAQAVWFLDWLAHEWREVLPPEYRP